MGQIHHDAEVAYFTRKPECRAIVRPFLSCFDVTRAFTKTRGDDRLECFYLKPEPFIAELVGLERELFVAYAPFRQFQARTIKLHDAVVEEDHLRLDPIGTVLVSEAPDTATAVREFLAAEPERPPLVPISTAELAQIHSANDLRALFCEHLFRRDLFALESPLRSDTTFFGRSERVTELLDRFRAGQNSGLFGLRRIGKTSVLYSLARRAQAGEVAGSVYLDCSSPGVYQLNWFQVLQRIVSEVAGPLGLQRAERNKLRALSTTYDPKFAAAHFKADIQILADKLPGRRLLLLLDEMEHVTFDLSPAGHWGEDYLPLWQTLRSVHQDTRGRVGFVIAGVNPHATEADRVGSFDNPLFATTKAFYLSPFDRATTREMVRRIGRYMGLRFQEGVFPLVQETYGGHPYLVRQACSELAKKVSTRPGEVTVDLFEQETQAIALTLERNIRQILNVLAIWYPDEYEMLRLLAHGERAAFVEFANQTAEFTQHVEGYGLVHAARTEPRFAISLVKDHLCREPRKQVEAAAGDQEGLLAEISRRRNRVESAMRKLLREGLQFAEGKKAMTVALSALKDDRRAVLNQYSYRDVWQELYFDELSAILEKNYASFQKRLSEERETVLNWMRHINRCRSDAHAKSMNEDDVAFVRVCFRRLEEVLSLD